MSTKKIIEEFIVYASKQIMKFEDLYSLITSPLLREVINAIPENLKLLLYGSRSLEDLLSFLLLLYEEIIIKKLTIAINRHRFVTFKDSSVQYPESDNEFNLSSPCFGTIVNGNHIVIINVINNKLYLSTNSISCGLKIRHECPIRAGHIFLIGKNAILIEKIDDYKLTIWLLNANRSVELKDGNIYKFGRLENQDLCFDDESVSRNHGEFFKKNNCWMIKDNSSLNGTIKCFYDFDTYKNGAESAKVKIKENCLLAVDQKEFEVIFS